MATNAIYLARVNRAKLEEAQNQDFDTIRSGNYDQDTLYILDDSVVTMAQIELDDKSDMLSQINGLNVLAPGWFERQNCGKSYPPVSSVSRLEVGDSVSFAEKGPEAAGLDGRKYLVVGWSGQEADFTWSEGNQADITIPLASGPVTAVKLKLGALVAPQHPFQRVSVSINDVASLTTVLKEPSATTLQIPIPKEALRSLGTKRILNLHLTLPDAVRPVDVGLNGDTRELAVSLYSLSLK
jgi:hypothetical protein